MICRYRSEGVKCDEGGRREGRREKHWVLRKGVSHKKAGPGNSMPAMRADQRALPASAVIWHEVIPNPQGLSA